MKLPLSWLKEFVTIDANVDELTRRLSVAGLVVEGIERTRAPFEGVVVAKVLKVERHPNADRLTVCEVDAGAVGHVSVVCGAPNVKAGMTAALAKVGARLVGRDRGEQAPPLEAAVIRGVRSEGMLCSERELGISDEHGGILALDGDAALGADAAGALMLDDVVLDIEITANRGDCLSILGLAREVAALCGAKLQMPRLKPIKPPADSPAPPFSVEIKAPDLCPRYAALKMTHVKIGKSPLWMRRRLELCGMRALNAVVDATNYVMLELGQPIHAFDFDKIAGARMVVRPAGEEREFITLDNLARALAPTDLMIADAEKSLALAGVMGGLNSEVSDTTTAILLESAYFDPIAVARTSRRLGLRSEASYRFERGVDRAGQVAALEHIAELLRRTARARPASAIIDVDAKPAVAREIALDLAAMESLLGAKIAPPVVKARLKSLGAKVAAKSRGVLAVVPPSWRADLNEPADLAEEVARLSGLDDIPAAMPARLFGLVARNRERDFARASREVMLGCGLTEAITLAFIAPADNRRYPGLVSDGAAAPVEVENPLSAELSELRLSLIPGLVNALRFNLNREAAAFHAFELGNVYRMRGDRAEERLHLAGVSYGTFALAGIGQKGIAASFTTMKGVLEAYFDALGAREHIAFTPVDAARAPFAHPGRSAWVHFDDAIIGMVGELHPAEAMRLDLGDACALCELDLDKLISYGLAPRKTVEAPPKFPVIRRDLALVVDRDFPAEMVVRTVRECASALLETVELFDVYEGPAIAAGKKSVALACRYRAKDRTLTDEEVNRIHAVLVEQARMRLGAELRQ
jgi:phenylalanyl-tRNA synthetase beta chain